MCDQFKTAIYLVFGCPSINNLKSIHKQMHQTKVKQKNI